MAFQTGTVGNSHNLVDKIYGFLLSIGWTHVATLKTGITNPAPDGYDYVFHSTGENGNSDIYIRVAAGECDRWVNPTGDIQHPYTDGYTEYINAFAYQYFPPSGTTPEDGFNEIGRYGPLLYVANDVSNGVGELYEYNLFTGSTSRSKLITDQLLQPAEEEVWFDGILYVYTRATTSSTHYLTRINLHDQSRALLTESLSFDQYSNTGGIYIKRENGVQHYYKTNSSSYYEGNKEFLQRYTVSSDSWLRGEEAGATWWGPPWSDVNTYKGAGCECMGPKRKRQDHNWWAYYFKGADTGGATSQWAQFNLQNETFSNLISPSTPWAIGQWASYRPYCVFVTKEQSGYEHDRIYIWRGNAQTGFASVPIDDDGYVVASEGWTVHASTPFVQRGGIHAVCVDGTILCTAGSDSSGGADLYRWVLPSGDPTQNGSWSLVQAGFLNYALDVGPYVFRAHNHLCGRVRVDEFQTNTYWLFADKDRLVAVVKNARNEYEYLYVGRFKPYASEDSANLTQAASTGDTLIFVSDTSLFTAGRKYMISDTTGNLYNTYVSPVTNASRKMAPSEVFTVLSITTEGDGTGSLLITALENDYSYNSKVGEDPNPVTVRVHSIEKAQTFDSINLADNINYADPPWQTYNLVSTADDTLANATDYEARSLGTYLYGIVLMNEGDTYTGKEVRGQLIDVYSCGTSISSEEEIAVGSKTYIAFDIALSGEIQRIVVGPK